MKTKFSGILTLFLAFVVQLTFAQEKTISGTISDENGLPLPGVNIIVKGTTSGTQTDFDGNYTIGASAGDVLSYSFLGYTTKEMTVGATNSISFAMTVDADALDEVVITALGIKRKQDELTTANQVVKAEELTQAQNPDLVQGLSGKVSGLQINTTNSGVNQSTRIVLRGNRSLTQNNEALIVIDGIISNGDVLSRIDPNLIENVNVIKGANGAALYGSAGANGALIVTTKKGGGSDKMTVQFNSAVSFDDVQFLPQRQKRYGQGWNGVHTAYENGGWGPEFDGQLVATGLPLADGTYRYFPYSPIDDNIKEFFTTGTTYQNTVSLSAGDMQNGYVFLSAANQDRAFIIENDESKNSTFNFKGGKQVGKWTLEGNVIYLTNSTKQSTGTLYTELLQTATNIPVEEFSAPDNSTHWTSYYRSPYWIRDNERTQDRTDRFVGIINLGYEFNDNISIRYTGNLNQTSRSGFNYVNGVVDTLNVGGGDYTTVSSYGDYNSSFMSYYGDVILNFDYKFADKISLNALVGTNTQDQRFASTSNSGSPVTIPGFYNISNVSGTPNVANSRTRLRRMAVFANVDLGYDDYLFLNLTARNDWTSVLDSSNNSFFYPSVGVSFIPTKAFDNFGGDVMNFMKVAASWVRVGNDGSIAASAIVPTYVGAPGYPYGSLNSFVQPTGITDPFLEPEFLETFEFNLNMGFLSDRITLDASYFTGKGSNQINNVSTSFASGISNNRVNIGKTEFDGYEINLGVKPLWSADPRGFRWDLNMFYSTNETIVTSINGEADELAINTFGGASPVGVFAVVGEEFPIIKGTSYQRDPSGRVLIDPTTGTPLQNADLEILGKSNPDYILGLNTSVTYKGLRLAATMDYRTGHQFFSGTKSWLSWSGHLIESAENGRTGFIYPNSAIETSPGVYEANTGIITGGTSYSSFLNYYSNDYYTVAENFVLDATAFKVRELALSYTLPTNMLEKTAISNVVVGLNARNPFIVLPKENRGYNDPETSSTTGNGQGIALTNQYPSTRSLGFSLNVTF